MQTKREMQNGCPNQASYQAGTKWPISQRLKERKKKERIVEKERKTNEKHFLNKQKRGGKKCQRATRQRLDTRNPCTRHNPFSRQLHGRATYAYELPHTKNEQFVKHRDYPPHSYIVNERYNSRNKRASRERKEKVNGKNRQLAQPSPTLTQGGHEIASLLN